MKIFLIGYSAIFLLAITALISFLINLIFFGKMKRIRTLELISKSWIQYLESLATIFFMVCILLNFVLAYFGYIELGTGALVGVVGSLTLTLLHTFCFYNLIKCPGCGGSLTEYKNGKRMPMKNGYTSLANEMPCRYCGWEPK